MRSKIVYSLFLLACLSVSAKAADKYVNLDSYKEYSYQTRQEGFTFQFLKNGWYAFRSSLNESVLADNIGSEQFWNTLRGSLEDGTFYNRMANYQTNDHLTGSDIFFKALYSSVDQVSVKYQSALPNGDSITLSGKLFLPKNKKTKHIIIANHYTICADREAPSNACSIEGIFAIKDYIVLMPDYIGYGITDSLTHPYLHLQSSVTSALDLLKASIPFLNANEYTYYKSIILVGYSQGAAVALAVQKELEEQYSSLYPIQKVFAGAGPYDLEQTFNFYLRHPVTDIPCSIPMLILGMNYGENLGLKTEDFFQPELMEKYPLLIESKSKMMIEVNTALDHNISLLLKPVIFHTDEYPTSVLYEAIQKNNILYWTPKADLYLFHSTTDNMVPFLNSEHLKAQFDQQQLDNIQYDFAPYGNHMRAAVTFFEKVYNSL